MAYNRCEQYDIFSQIFQEPLKKDHELLLLAKRIDWDEITHRLRPFHSKRGRQAKRIRLMVGLHENVYWRGLWGQIASRLSECRRRSC